MGTKTICMKIQLLSRCRWSHCKRVNSQNQCPWLCRDSSGRQGSDCQSGRPPGGSFWREAAAEWSSTGTGGSAALSGPSASSWHFWKYEGKFYRLSFHDWIKWQSLTGFVLCSKNIVAIVKFCWIGEIWYKLWSLLHSKYYRYTVNIQMRKLPKNHISFN